MSAHLEARGVAFEYPGPLRAVDGVDLALRRGELTCVLGPNGSGKSTLLKLLCGLARPQSGEVLLDGRPLARLRDRERARRIAVVPQALLAVPQLEVASFVLGARYSHLGFWKRAERSDHELVESALAQVDAADLAGRSLDELSGGQRQRVLVARALAQETDHLLVDEPTSSLDLPHQLAVFELLARFAREGRAVLVVTHDLNLASQFSNDLVILDRGRVHARGTPAEVLRSTVLQGIYGEKLHYGELAGPAGERRPFVVPWYW